MSDIVPEKLAYAQERGADFTINAKEEEIAICGSRLHAGHFPLVIYFIKQRELNLAGFVIKVFPLDEMRKAFDYVERNNAAARKVVIKIAD